MNGNQTEKSHPGGAGSSTTGGGYQMILAPGGPVADHPLKYIAPSVVVYGPEK